MISQNSMSYHLIRHSQRNDNAYIMLLSRNLSCLVTLCNHPRLHWGIYTEYTKQQDHLLFPRHTDQVNPGEIYNPLLMSHINLLQSVQMKGRLHQIFNTQKFPVCIKTGPQLKRHPVNLTQLWEALESTWASIPVERFFDTLQSMPRQIEAILRAKVGATQYQEQVPNIKYTQQRKTERK